MFPQKHLIYWIFPTVVRFLGGNLVPQKVSREQEINMFCVRVDGNSASFIRNPYTYCALFFRDADFYFRLLHTALGL